MSKERFSASQFDFQIDGMAFEGVTSISGIDMNIEKLEVQEGAHKQASYRKGRSYMADFEIERCMTDFALFDWFKQCQVGKVEKRSASLIMRKDDGSEFGRFNLIEIWPITYQAPSFDTRFGSSVASERVTFACEDIVKG